MRNAQNGSMLLEALIALSITSFLVFSVANITSNTSQSFKTITAIGQHQQKIIAVTNQLERDLSTLVAIPTKQPADDKDADKATADAKKKKVSRALIGQADFNDTIKIQKKDFPTFKVINGLTTSPLESYGENKPHLVRFTYKLIKQTLKAPHHKTRAFKLYRRETTNLDDLNVKQENEMKDSNFSTSSEWVLICDNISDLFVRYYTFAPSQPTLQKPDEGTANETKNTEKSAQNPAKREASQASPQEAINSFTWPISKLGEEFSQRVPHSIHVILRLWNSDFTKTFDHQSIIPCMAYAGTLPEHLIEAKAAEKPATTDQSANTQKTDGTNTQVAAPGATAASAPAASPLPPTPPQQLPVGNNFKEMQPPAQARQQPPQAVPNLDYPHGAAPHYSPQEQAANEAFFAQYPPEVIMQMPPEQIMKVMPPALQQEVHAHIQEMQRDPLKYIQNVMELLKHER